MNSKLPFKIKSIILRQFTVEDVPKIFLMSQETGMRQWIPDQVYEDEQATSQVLEYLIRQYNDPLAPRKKPYVVGICLNETGELIGHVGLSPAQNQVEIGYAIESIHQGNGYATLAVAAMSDLGITTFDLPFVLGIVDSDNTQSCKVLEKAGFQLIEESMKSHHGKTRLVKTYRKENETIKMQ